MNHSLRGKVVVIVGGRGLLGSAFMRAVRSQGATAVCADLSGTEVAVDITSERSVEAMLARVRKRYGRIDAVVNSAYPKNRRFGRPFERTRYRDFCDNAARHLGGYFLVSQKSALFFKKQGGGNLVNLASIYAGAVPRFDIYRGTGKSMPVEYAAIKAGIVQMSRWLAAYAKKWRVRVNCISPGGILDGQSAAFLKRYNAFGASKGMLDAADVCGTLVFLLSDASRYVTGQNITVDDGWTL